MKTRTRKRIERELPPVGTILQAKFKGNGYKAKIVKDKSQKSGKAISFEGKLYSSMTAAAQAVTKQSTNGWRFWKFKGSK